MKIIHCADLHLDSSLKRNLTNEQAKERRAELLRTFENMVSYAVQEQVQAILIAGDLFDTKNISATTRNVVLAKITENPAIAFYYLKGNHDHDNFLAGLDKLPENLYMFGETWTKYQIGKIVISGLELSEANNGSAYTSLVLDNNDFNIVMLHGQESETAVKDKAEVINLKALRNKGIDYLALGHIHAYKEQALDARATYCYPGCLEGRGYDECGEHGFVMLDIDETTGKYTHEFIPFAKRKLHTIEVDITGCLTSAEIDVRVEMALAASLCNPADLVKIVLIGAVDVACEKDIEYLLAKYKARFYSSKIYDESTLKINYEDYMMDASLKGEYVRLIMNDDSLTDDNKAAIIRCGLQALAGEEVQ